MGINRIVLSLTASICFVLVGGRLPATGQNIDTGPQRAKLVARKKTAEGDNYVNAAFSFEYGVNGEKGKQITRNDWELLFGNSPIPDAFDVTMVTDDCSRILDLGELDWGNEFKIPLLPAHPEPTREPSVKAIVGHMYLVHTKDRETDLYVLFLVEELEPGESVTISWKVIPSPEKQNAQE